MPDLLTRASLLFDNLARFVEPPRSCLLQSCRVCKPVRRATPLVPLAVLPGLQARASLRFLQPCRSANPYELTFLHRRFVEPPRSCLLQSCRVCKPVRRATPLVPLAVLPGLQARASLRFLQPCRSANPYELTFLHRRFVEPPRSCLLQSCRVCKPVRRATPLVPLAVLPGLQARASLRFLQPCRSANPYELTFLHRRFVEPPRSCLLQSCRVCKPVRRATPLVPLAVLPGLQARASLRFLQPCRSANPYELTFLHRRFVEPPRSCLLQSCRVCKPVRRATPLVPLAVLPGLQARASLRFLQPCRSANPYELTFLHRRFVEPPRSCLLQSCRVCKPVRRATPLVPLAVLPGLQARASLRFLQPCRSANPYELTFLHRRFVEPPRSCLLQSCRVCKPVRRATPLVPLAVLPGLQARASLRFLQPCRSANPYELTFLHRRFVEPPRSCLLQSCRVCKPVRRATPLVPLAVLPGLQARASLRFLQPCRSANPYELTFLHRRFVEPPRSCLLQSCRVCKPVRRATPLVPLAVLPGLQARASLRFLQPCRSANPYELTFLHRRFVEPPRSCLLQSCRVCKPVRRATPLVPLAVLPGLQARASLRFLQPCRSANPYELTFLHRRFVEPPRSCLLQSCRVCKPVRAYVSCNLALCANPREFTFLATLSGLLTPASSLFCFLPGLLTRASLLFCNVAGSANPYELTFLHLKFVEPPRSCLMQPCRVRRATSLVPLATMPGLLTRASLLFCNLAGSANPPCELTFLHRKFAEPPANPCELTFLQPCRVCYPVRAYFSATLPGLLILASLLSYTASSPSHLARASCNLAGSANPCELTFLQPCRVRRATSLVPLATLPGRLTRASLLSFTAVHRATSLVPLITLPGPLIPASLLSCTASSPSHLARASYNLAGSANPCELTFLHRKFAEPPRSCHLQPCRVCYPVRAYFSTTLPGLLTRASLLSCTASSLSHPALRRATSLVPLATLPGLLTRARLLFCNLAGSANPCELTFLHRKFAEPPRSCLL
ncbi:hypothetical protein CRG98_021371 [Punica granatum]|uniref:Uncharacterized protein n=1 Tax=Punica granatum TaxID=22663 RepID=A0A2I0JPL5_PUNGR|nr:hypothetical protein CRG98_021371 [Punica granatum]